MNTTPTTEFPRHLVTVESAIVRTGFSGRRLLHQIPIQLGMPLAPAPQRQASIDGRRRCLLDCRQAR